MKLSKTVEMTKKLVAETLEMTKKGRADAANEGFNTEVFLLQINAQIQKNLEHIQMFMEGIAEDAENIEQQVNAAKIPDEYGRDRETGKKVGRMWPANVPEPDEENW